MLAPPLTSLWRGALDGLSRVDWRTALERVLTPLGLSLTALLLFAIFSLWLVRGLAPSTALDYVEVQADADGVVLGRMELGQLPGPSSAERNHLLIKNVQGRWFVANVAVNRRVDVQTTQKRTRYLKRWHLQRGDDLSIGPVWIRVAEVGSDFLVLVNMRTNTRVVWRGGRLDFGAHQPPDLDDPGPGRHSALKTMLRNREALLFDLGGRVNTNGHWSLEDLPPSAARIMRTRDGFWLAPGQAAVPLLMARKDGPPMAFHDLLFPLNGPEGQAGSLVVGRTLYLIDARPDRLRLTPAQGFDLLPFNHVQPPDPEGVRTRFRILSWPGEGRPLSAFLMDRGGQLLLILIVVAGLTFLAQRFFFRPLRWESQPGRPVPPALVLFAALLLPTVCWLAMKGRLDPGYWLPLVWLGWLLTTVLLHAQNRLHREAGGIWVCAVVLAWLGLLVLLQLAAGADTTRWLRHPLRHAVMLSVTASCVSLLCMAPIRSLWSMMTNFATNETACWQIIRWLSVVVVLTPLLIQFFYGQEEGLFGLFQPSELAKLFLVVLAGFVAMHLRELRRKSSPGFEAAPFHYVQALMRLLLFGVAAVFVVLIGVRDLSPVLILVTFLLYWSWESARGPREGERSNFAVRGAVLAVVLCIIGLFTWVYTTPTIIPDRLPLLGVLHKPDRLLVWSNPDLYPHSGAQVLQSMRLVAQGGWTGAADSWFGLNGRVNWLPAVQDDFIGAFFLHKFGTFFGIALVCVQMTYLVMVFRATRKLESWAVSVRNYRFRLTGTFMLFVLLGLAWMHLTQWGISWANVLGLLPVMGQPMTWISAGNSHVLCIALPLLLGALAASWVAEEHSPGP
jgi:cell division protein FtsW